MRSWAVWFFLSLCLCQLGFGRSACAQDIVSPLRVEEGKMRFHLLPHTQLELPVVNSTEKSISGKFALQLLNFEDDSVAAEMSGTFVETPGETIEKVEWPFENLPSDTPSTLGWFRLRYSFEPVPESDVAPTTGIVQLGQIITDGFSIEIAGAEKVAPGSKYPLRVHVENPGTHRLPRLRNDAC